MVSLNPQAVLVLCADLISNAKIREACAVRDLPLTIVRQRVNLPEDLTPYTVFIDGGHPECLALLAELSDSVKSKLTCFLPHVEKELSAELKALGVGKVLPRSKFFNSLSILLGD